MFTSLCRGNLENFNERFNLHNTGFKHSSKYRHCKTLFDFFTKGICKRAKYRVQIIEKIEGYGKSKRGSLDPYLSQNRRAKERECHTRMK